ncbi:hypothetical protein GCM10010196_35110 [Agromyces mediolanus]|uniref:Uncharacterized protein n=2 Tax=Agromyces mediolanus TaxID=41986 RepID=A0A918KWR3_AGRME|nr:hypothetical protein [Agromyces mediolanus]GGR38160.1 hypothetical protein GCM10010196_35110 [Agromyces mediolanus]GLJ71717.1 hypothetical protein GCM10017583_09730 [Agromyces mediolanus]
MRFDVLASTGSANHSTGSANQGLRRAQPTRRFGALLAAAALAATLAGCAAGGGTATPSASPPASSGASVLPPVIVDLGAVDGTEVEVPVGGTVDLVGDDEHFLAWTAELSDPEVAEFVPGKDDGSAQFNPGLTALAEGDTEVTLTNDESGEKLEFTLVVVPAS